MPLRDDQAERPRADAGTPPDDIEVVIELTRTHEWRLGRIEERQDTQRGLLMSLDEQFRDISQQFGEVHRAFDRVDDRFRHVEQRLEFLGGQLAELLRRSAS
ncbi:MAG TPA: hypothetical protein VGI58_12760 [Streptosporangiaceae bacterium]